MQSFFLPRRYAPSKATIVGSVSAGTPADPSPFTQRQRLPIPVAFRRFGMYVLRVDGHSMTLADGSGIPHGSLVLVDPKDILTEYGHVYAFRLPDGAYAVKRLRLHQGRPAMHSDQEGIGPAVLDGSVRNCGRVYAVSVDGRAWRATGYRGWN